jgi:hypothetical protein
MIRFRVGKESGYVTRSFSIAEPELIYVRSSISAIHFTYSPPGVAESNPMGYVASVYLDLIQGSRA